MEEIKCSFCGKSYTDVEVLVADKTDTIFIYNECIEECGKRAFEHKIISTCKEYLKSLHILQ